MEVDPSQLLEPIMPGDSFDGNGFLTTFEIGQPARARSSSTPASTV